jgi:ubiquinone biosynthesis protein COQ9
MDDTEFDRALISAGFGIAAARGWDKVTVAGAARTAGLKLDAARARFPGRGAILMRFGRMADMAALAGVEDSGDLTMRDRLFDMVMRRIDAFQAHRDGLLALFRYLPMNPPASLLLLAATTRSMGWLLAATGVETTGIAGALRVRGLVAVWVYTVRAWIDDESADLAQTMAALDRALQRAEQAERMLPGRRTARTLPDDVVPGTDDGPAAPVADITAAPLPPPRSTDDATPPPPPEPTPEPPASPPV